MHVPDYDVIVGDQWQRYADHVTHAHERLGGRLCCAKDLKLNCRQFKVGTIACGSDPFIL